MEYGGGSQQQQQQQQQSQPAQQQPQQQNGGGWRSTLSFDERRKLVFILAHSIRNLGPDCPQEKVIGLAHQYEHLIYTNSNSKEEYIRQCKSKIQALAEMMANKQDGSQQQQQQQQAVTGQAGQPNNILMQNMPNAQNVPNAQQMQGMNGLVQMPHGVQSAKPVAPVKQIPSQPSMQQQHIPQQQQNARFPNNAQRQPRDNRFANVSVNPQNASTNANDMQNMLFFGDQQQQPQQQQQQQQQPKGQTRVPTNNQQMPMNRPQPAQQPVPGNGQNPAMSREQFLNMQRVLQRKQQARQQADQQQQQQQYDVQNKQPQNDARRNMQRQPPVVQHSPSLPGTAQQQQQQQLLHSQVPSQIKSAPMQASQSQLQHGQIDLNQAPNTQGVNVPPAPRTGQDHDLDIRTMPIPPAILQRIPDLPRGVNTWLQITDLLRNNVIPKSNLNAIRSAHHLHAQWVLHVRQQRQAQAQQMAAQNQGFPQIPAQNNLSQQPSTEVNVNQQRASQQPAQQVQQQPQSQFTGVIPDGGKNPPGAPQIFNAPMGQHIGVGGPNIQTTGVGSTNQMQHLPQQQQFGNRPSNIASMGVPPTGGVNMNMAPFAQQVGMGQIPDNQTHVQKIAMQPQQQQSQASQAPQPQQSPVGVAASLPVNNTSPPRNVNNFPGQAGLNDARPQWPNNMRPQQGVHHHSGLGMAFNQVSPEQREHDRQMLRKIFEEATAVPIRSQPLDNLTEEQKDEVRRQIQSMVPLYQRVDQLVPMFYFITRSHSATKRLIQLKFMFKEQMEALSRGVYLTFPQMLEKTRLELNRYFHFVRDHIQKQQQQQQQQQQPRQENLHQSPNVAPQQAQPQQQQRRPVDQSLPPQEFARNMAMRQNDQTQGPGMYSQQQAQFILQQQQQQQQQPPPPQRQQPSAMQSQFSIQQPGFVGVKAEPQFMPNMGASQPSAVGYNSSFNVNEGHNVSMMPGLNQQGAPMPGKQPQVIPNTTDMNLSMGKALLRGKTPSGKATKQKEAPGAQQRTAAAPKKTAVQRKRKGAPASASTPTGGSVASTPAPKPETGTDAKRTKHQSPLPSEEIAKKQPPPVRDDDLYGWLESVSKYLMNGNGSKAEPASSEVKSSGRVSTAASPAIGAGRTAVAGAGSSSASGITPGALLLTPLPFTAAAKTPGQSAADLDGGQLGLASPKVARLWKGSVVPEVLSESFREADKSVVMSLLTPESTNASQVSTDSKGGGDNEVNKSSPSNAVPSDALQESTAEGLKQLDVFNMISGYQKDSKPLDWFDFDMMGGSKTPTAVVAA